jgi:hypothetical protein
MSFGVLARAKRAAYAFELSFFYRVNRAMVVIEEGHTA